MVVEAQSPDDVYHGLKTLSRVEISPQAPPVGATWLDDALVVIDSSLEGNDGRYCFTLGHEVGHWQLHRPLREMDKVTFPLFSREPGAKATAAIVCRDGQRDSAEIQADKFAALLLMPASDVRAAVKLVTGEPLAIDNFVARKKAGERIAELRDSKSKPTQAIAVFDVEVETQDKRVVQRGKKALLVSKVPLTAVEASQ